MNHLNSPGSGWTTFSQTCTLHEFYFMLLYLSTPVYVRGRYCTFDFIISFSGDGLTPLKINKKFNTSALRGCHIYRVPKNPTMVLVRDASLVVYKYFPGKISTYFVFLLLKNMMTNLNMDTTDWQQIQQQKLLLLPHISHKNLSVFSLISIQWIFLLNLSHGLIQYVTNNHSPKPKNRSQYIFFLLPSWH